MTQKERFIVGSTRSARTASVNKQEGEKEKKKEKKRKISWVIIFDRCARAKSNFADRLPSSAEHVDARVLHAVYVCVLCKLFHLSLSLSLSCSLPKHQSVPLLCDTECTVSIKTYTIIINFDPNIFDLKIFWWMVASDGSLGSRSRASLFEKKRKIFIIFPWNRVLNF